MRLGHILVGYDGSPESKVALEWAIGLAKATEAEVLVQHVVSVGPDPASEALDLEAFEQTVSEMLDDAVRRAEAAGVRATKILSRGDVATLLLQEAAARGADLLVVGSLGRGRMARLLLGSVADKLVRSAPVPVLVAR